MIRAFELRIHNIRSYGSRVNHRSWLYKIGLHETWNILWTSEYGAENE